MDVVRYCYRFAEAEFDASRFELKVAGLPVEVEPRALAVLGYLLLHAGEVVTKDELLQNVWDGRVTVDKVLPNTMTKLRRALGEHAAQRIVTVARVGYRLDGPIERIAVGSDLRSETSFSEGQPVPGRPNFAFQQLLGAHRGSEVWLAVHAKTREPRVYKFASDGERLRSLKREATLLRVLQEGAEECPAFVSLIDWNFEHAPFFLECAYGGEDLGAWARQHLSSLDRRQRLQLFLQIVDGVSAAHALGVLHKDLKPSNVLIDGAPASQRARITDFGSGRLLDAGRLQQLGITRAGLTMTENLAQDSHSGTPMYLAPEVFAGAMPTVRSDVYALGLMLYQLLSGRIGEPMAAGWERDLDDPLLEADIRAATDVNPELRLASAEALAERLRCLHSRREAAQRAEAEQREAERSRQALQRARARRPFVWALMATLLTALAVSLGFAMEARSARLRAEAELARATAVIRFLDEDLISRGNPLVLARGAEAPLREVLLSARTRLQQRFEGQPLAEASVRASLGRLFATLDAWTAGEEEATRALALFEGSFGADHVESLRSRALLVHLLARQARFDDAEAHLARLRELADPGLPESVHALARAEASLEFQRGNYADAVPNLRLALDTAPQAEPGNEALRDSLRVDLIVALGYSAQHAEVRSVADALLDEVGQRSGDHALLGALVQLAAARSYSYLDEDARAEAMLLAAQRVMDERLDASHTRHLGLLNELTGLYFRRSDWERALPHAREVQSRIRARLGEEHNASLVSRGNLGRVLYEMGRDDEAVAELQPAYDGLVRTLGERAPQSQDLGYVLASVQVARGESEAAERLIATLDADALEKGRSTGVWTHYLQVLRGLAVSSSANPEAGRTLLSHGLPP